MFGRAVLCNSWFVHAPETSVCLHDLRRGAAVISFGRVRGMGRHGRSANSRSANQWLSLRDSQAAKSECVNNDNVAFGVLVQVCEVASGHSTRHLAFTNVGEGELFPVDGRFLDRLRLGWTIDRYSRGRERSKLLISSHISNQKIQAVHEYQKLRHIMQMYRILRVLMPVFLRYCRSMRKSIT